MCGVCTDLPIIAAAPFLAYDAGLFAIHTLVAGNAVNLIARRAGPPRAPLPLRYFGVFLALVVASVLALGGTMMIPFVFVLPFWIRYFVRNWRGPVPLLAAEARVMLGLLVLLVPLAYLLPVPVPAAH